jgi:hypothetical protein
MREDGEERERERERMTELGKIKNRKAAGCNNYTASLSSD